MGFDLVTGNLNAVEPLLRGIVLLLSRLLALHALFEGLIHLTDCVTSVVQPRRFSRELIALDCHIVVQLGLFLFLDLDVVADLISGFLLLGDLILQGLVALNFAGKSFFKLLGFRLLAL